METPFSFLVLLSTIICRNQILTHLKLRSGFIYISQKIKNAYYTKNKSACLVMEESIPRLYNQVTLRRRI